MEIKKQNKPEKLILLSNRYGDQNYLRQIDEKKYKYESKNDYLRVGYKGATQEDGYQFIDPSGGPFMAIGSKVFGIEGKISNIESTEGGFILTFE